MKTSKTNINVKHCKPELCSKYVNFTKIISITTGMIPLKTIFPHKNFTHGIIELDMVY